MSRRFKETRQTLLVVGEGKSEKLFLRYLGSLYRCQSSFTPTIVDAKGGDPNAIVACAIKQNACVESAFDRILVLMDTDKSWNFKKDTEANINKLSINIIGSKPNIEGFLLDILGKGDCKFEESFQKMAAKLSPGDYQKSFPKKVLESSRKRIHRLDALIKFFEGKQEKDQQVYLCLDD